MRILEMVQCSPAWWNARRGCITASKAKSILSSKGAEPSRGQEHYIRELIEEVKFLGPSFFSANAQRNKAPNKAIEDGVIREPEARAWVSFHLGCKIRQVGLLVHESNVLRCSPDGLLILPSGELEGLELKCPQEETQQQYVLDPSSLLRQYKQQVHFSLIVSGLPKWTLASYCPPLDEVVMEVKPDAYTERLREELLRFVGRYDETMRTLLGYGLPEMIARLHPTDAYADVA